MRLKTVLGAMAMVCALLATSYAAVPTIISHQGRLLNAAGQPVNGAVPIQFSLFDVSADGVALASETQVVNVDNGLFSVQLASLVGSDGLPDVPELWLGVKVGTDAELVPRLRIGSAPYALTSSRVQGDITTSPGSLAIGDLTGDGRADIVTSPDQSSLTIDDFSTAPSLGGAHLKGLVTSGSPGTSSLSALYLDIDDDGDGTSVSTVRLSAEVADADNAPGCDFSLLVDTDDDGVPESSVQSQARSKQSECKSNTKATYTTKSSIHSDTSKGGVSCSIDNDNDGTSERFINLTAAAGTAAENADAAAIRVVADIDDNGVADMSSETVVDSGGARMAIKTKGTGAQRGEITVSHDSDGDGIQEKNIGLYTSDVTGQTAVKCATDFDDDGIPDIGISSSASTDRAILESFFERGDKPTESQFSNLLDSDGIYSTNRSANAVGTTLGISTKRVAPDSVDEISTVSDGSSSSTYSVRNRLNQLETSLQNVGLLARTTVTQACDDTSASITIKRNDGPGTPSVIEIQDLTTSPLRVSHRLALDSGADGIADKQILLDCNDDDAGLAILAGVAVPKFIDITARETGPIPGGASDVSLVMGLGADSLIEMRGDGTSTSVRFRSGTKYWKIAVEPLSSTLSATNGLGVVALDLNGDGRIGIDGAAHATNPVHHSSGAHLTVGGTWTNASDKNAKENFSEVDGEELLEKIEDLAITQWNYKSEDESITHIGPTAQDFKDAFGVGGDDKSISTVDPSGIALAAIKEMIKQNQELSARVKALEKSQKK